MSNYKKAAWAPPGVTKNFSAEGLLNLINPLSSLYKSSPDYVPNWWLQAFRPSDTDAEGRKNASRVAHVLAKVLAGGAVFGGAAWLLRAFMHSLDIDNVEDIKTSARASRKLDTIKSRPVAPVITGAPQTSSKSTQPLQEEKNKQKLPSLQKTQSLSYDIAKGALPPLAALAAVLMSFKLADKTFDLSLNSKLNKELAKARAESQNLAMQRVLQNRGVSPISPKSSQAAIAQNQQLPVNSGTQKLASLQKTAESNFLPQGLQASIGLLLAAMMAIGGVAGFNWQHANSANLAKYKAYKKGLQTYNKQRLLNEPNESAPLDPELLDYLDSNLGQAKKQTPVAPAESSLKEILV